MIEKRKIQIASIATTILYIGLITTLSLVQFSEDTELPEIENLDKIAHFCFYFGLNTLLLISLLIYRSTVSIKHISIATLFSILYSGAIELLQPLTSRSSDEWDLLANEAVQNHKSDLRAVSFSCQ